MTAAKANTVQLRVGVPLGVPFGAGTRLALTSHLKLGCGYRGLNEQYRGENLILNAGKPAEGKLLYTLFATNPRSRAERQSQ